MTEAVQLPALSRPLSKAERFYWLYDQASSTNFVLIAELDRVLAPEAVAAALDAARRRHPPLRSRILVDLRGRVVVTAAEPAAFPVTQVEGDWPAEAARQLDLPFTPGSYPLVRVSLLRPSAGAACVALFTFNHGLSDARSAALLVEEVLARVGGTWSDAVEPRPSLPPQEALYPQRFLGWRARWHQLGVFFHDLLEGLGLGPARQIPGVPRRWQGPRANLTLPHVLDAPTSADLLRRCREEGTTLQGALTAAQLLAVRAEFDGDAPISLLVGSAVNMRPHLMHPVQDQDLGMYASFIPAGCKVARDADLWALARETKSRLTTKLARGNAHLVWSTFLPDFFFSPDERGARTLDTFIARLPPSTFVTNIGRLGETWPLPPGLLRGLHFAMAPQSGSVLCTAAASSQGRLHLNCTINQTMLAPEVGRRVARRLVALLRGVATGGS